MRLTTSLALIGICALVLIGGGVWWLVKSRGPETVAPATPVVTDKDDVSLSLSKPRIRVISGGKITWDIEVDTLDMAKRGQVQRFHNMKRAIALHDGKEEMTLSADTLEHNTVSGNMDLMGNVTLEADKLLMHTAAVQWDGRKELMRIPGRLNAQFGDYTLLAPQGATYDVVNGVLTTHGQVRITTKGAALSAGSMQLDVATERMVLTDPVEMEMETAAATEWAEGNDLPEIPEIPASVRKKYEKHQQEKADVIEKTDHLHPWMKGGMR